MKIIAKNTTEFFSGMRNKNSSLKILLVGNNYKIMTTRNDRFKGPINKKRYGHKGIKGKQTQHSPPLSVETENDYSRALTSSRWKSWHNTIRDIDNREKGKEWRRHYPSESSKSLQYSRHAQHRHSLKDTAHYSVSYYATAQSFHMELGDDDFRHYMPWEHMVSDTECDLELTRFLTETYQTADSLLSTHATRAQERIEKERQLATEKWLMSRTPEERLQYLQRHAHTNVGE